MTPRTGNRVSASNNKDVVAAYFSNRADAQRAIDDLLTEGFEARQIGAAFHSTPATVSTAPAEAEVGSKTLRSAIDSDTIGSGPASDTRAVTPAGLSTGSGSVISGAGRPGPIPGSEIPQHRRAAEKASSTNPLPATGSFHESSGENSWWEKLKYTFGSDNAYNRRDETTTNTTSMNFGTGEGHIATYPETDEYVYSGSAFESAFSGMGVSPSHASSLVNDLRRGGAIVSVAANGQMDVVERVLQRNHGRIRYEATTGSAVRLEDAPGGRVRVYGELSRTYPGYLAGAGSHRKAS